jgi:hypothetical protein
VPRRSCGPTEWCDDNHAMLVSPVIRDRFLNSNPEV